MNLKKYLKRNEFNNARIIKEIEKLILKKGGKIVTDFYADLRNDYFLIDRTTQDNIIKLKSDIEKMNKRLENNKKLEKEQIKNIKSYKKECENKLQLLENSKYKEIEIKNSNLSYINFELNNYIYHIELKENSFFNSYFIKEKTTFYKNEYIVENSHYTTEFNNFDYFPEIFDILDDKTIKNYAENLLELLENSKESEIYQKNVKKYKEI